MSPYSIYDVVYLHISFQVAEMKLRIIWDIVCWLQLHFTCVSNLEEYYKSDHSFNSLCPSDTIYWHISGSKLAQVMACCPIYLMTQTHYLKQCWFLNWVLCHSTKINYTECAQDINWWNEFEKYTCEITSTSIRGQWVKLHQNAATHIDHLV